MSYLTTLFNLSRTCYYLFIKNYTLALPVLIGFFYFTSNLFFKYGLDDTTNYLNALHHIGSNGFWDILQGRFKAFFNPPSPDSIGLFRPLRTAHTFLAVYLSQYIFFLPDFIAAITASLLAYILIKFFEVNFIPPNLTIIMTLWFFGCIPVVAMGHIVLVSQFFVIFGIFITTWLFHIYIQTGKYKFLALSLTTIFALSFYGEAIIIASISIGFYGAIAFWKRNLNVGLISFGVSLTGIFLVLSNAFLLTFDPEQITRTITSVINKRGHSISNNNNPGELSIIWEQIANYFHIYRPQIFTGIIFSISPYLYFLSIYVFFILLIYKQIYFIPSIIGALVAISIIIPNTIHYALGGSLIIITLYYARTYSLPASVLLGSLTVLGPIFVIDTHISYLLPALCFFLFHILYEAYKEVAWKYFQYSLKIAIFLLPLILFGNYFNGAYLSYAVAKDNEAIADELKINLKNSPILTNSRHALDFYFYADLGGDYKKLKNQLMFTTNPPGMLATNELPTRADFKKWLDSKINDYDSIYSLFVDCKRLPCKGYFSAPKYLDYEACPKTIKWTHTFDIKVLNFDLGFLTVPFFYHKNLSTGFLAYPVFPDMISAIGIEYSPFQKRLFATYRLFEYRCNLNLANSTEIDKNKWRVELIRAAERGFNIWMVNGVYYAKPQNRVYFSSNDLNNYFSSYDFNAVMGFIDINSNKGNFKVINGNHDSFTLLSHKNKFYAIPRHQWEIESIPISQVIYGCSPNQLKVLINEYNESYRMTVAEITASTQFNSYGPQYLLENHKGNPKHIWHSAKRPLYPQWIKIKFNRPRKLSRINIRAQGLNKKFPERAPKEFIIQGSQDGSIWKDLLEIKDAGFTAQNMWQTFPFKNANEYLLYRIFIKKNGGDPSLLTIQQIILN
ncbi:discoidin domain-containing protein [Nitrospina sp. 32_T5]|uniref:discoidin domain-containing protein n=1 Tax=unclassified Nitrospina TaxID=2638683 RepID=UPI003F954057